MVTDLFLASVLDFVQVNKNAMLCKSIDELFENGSEAIQHSALKELMQKVR